MSEHKEVIPDAAVEAAGRVVSARFPRLDDRAGRGLAREILAAAAPHLMVDTGAMSEDRKVRLTRASTADYKQLPPDDVTISSLDDLEALCVKYGNPLIISVNEDGKLSFIEVYDDYIE